MYIYIITVCKYEEIYTYNNPHAKHLYLNVYIKKRSPPIGNYLH